MKRGELYEIGERSMVWLRLCGIEEREDFLQHSPEEIYEMVLVQKLARHPSFCIVAKPLLYALRANRHYLETGERIPFHFWKKVTE